MSHTSTIDRGLRGPVRNDDPADDVVPVSASDTNGIDGQPFDNNSSKVYRGLLVDSAGVATIVTAAGNLRTDVPLQQGYNPIRCKQVKSTGLAASGIWALT